MKKTLLFSSLPVGQPFHLYDSLHVFREMLLGGE